MYINFKEIKKIIKGSIIIRAICSPYMNIKKKIEYRKYQDSGEVLKLRKLKDKHRNQRCFIIGNGPSLKVSDINRIKENDVTIAANRIFNIFDKTSWRPNYYIAEDPDGMEEMITNISKYNMQTCILGTSAKRYKKITNNDDVIYGYWTNGKFIINRYNDTHVHISKDISKYFSIGYTVAFSAIQLAIYMGIKEIYLIGIDFNYSVVADKFGRMHHLDGIVTYFDGKERRGNYLNYYSVLMAYEKAREYAEKNGIKIYNATRGGKLEVFERVNFDEII